MLTVPGAKNVGEMQTVKQDLIVMISYFKENENSIYTTLGYSGKSEASEKLQTTLNFYERAAAAEFN